MEMDWSKHGQTKFQIGARALAKKLSVTEWPSESGKKKSFRYLISCLLVLASKRETGSVLISSRRTSLFAEKESQKDNFQAPEWLFLSKEGRSILFFFFRHQRKKLLAFPQENRATISAFLLRNFPLRIWKDRSLIIISWRCSGLSPIPPCRLPSAWTVAIENEPCTTQLFAEKQTVKQAHHYRKITERGTIAKQKSRH